MAEETRLERVQSRFESEGVYQLHYSNGREKRLKPAKVQVQILSGVPGKIVLAYLSALKAVMV